VSVVLRPLSRPNLALPPGDPHAGAGE